MPVIIKKFKNKTNPLFRKYKKIVKRKKYIKRRKPVRFSGSRVSSRYRRTRMLSRALSNYGENKFNGTLLQCLTPVDKPVGSQPIKFHFINLGNSLDGFLGNEWNNPMHLYNFPVAGNTNDPVPPAQQREGASMYLRKTHLKFEIQMLPRNTTTEIFNDLNNAIEFRFIMFKANRKYQQYGIPAEDSPKPNNSLFLTPANASQGYDAVSADFSTYEYMNQPINKRQWVVMADRKFTLQPTSLAWKAEDDDAQLNASTGRYPPKKTLTYEIPIFKKSYFSAGTSAPFNSSIPTNWDSQTMIIIMAVRSGYCATGASSPNADSYRLTVCGTTTARDS